METCLKTQVFEIVTCYKCGVSFGLAEGHRRTLLRDHTDFYCPNGHRQSYQGETEAQRYKRWYENEQRIRCRTEHEANTARASLSAMKGVATKRAKKLEAVAKGKCPECGQVFKNLRRHMHRVHEQTEKEN
jgi:hypothetical protein